MKTIDNPEEFYLYYESMFIITSAGKEKFVELPPFLGNDGQEPLTLKDLSDKYGKDALTITLYCETYTSGSVFRYNNYGEGEWVQVGTMDGFA